MGDTIDGGQEELDRMKAAGNVPVPMADLDDLGSVLDGPGPFLTVHLLTDGTVENAAARSEQRWKGLRRRLLDDGAPESVVALVDPLVEDAHLHGDVLTVVADDTRVLLIEHLDDAVDQDRGSWGRLPDLVPVIRARQSQLPYVLAFADRGGADLVAAAPGSRAIERSAGDDEPERKVHPGGWSQRRYQQRAENDWAATASDVAEEVAALSNRVDARLVVLGGDVRATHMIRDDLPAELGAEVHLIDQGRAADGSEEAREREIRRLMATAVAADTVALLEKFKEETGQDDRAANGPAATVEALNRAAVEVLLVHDGDVDDLPVAFVGTEAIPVGLDRSAVAQADHLEEARLVDSLVRAAIGTGATVRVIPSAGPVRDGVGALLRWSNPTP
jgi:hypothetical protein